jgi:hypothetical protein
MDSFMVSPYSFENFLKYEFLHGSLLFSTMMHTPTHELFGILPMISTPLLIRRKFNELVMVIEYFYKSLRIKITKIWGLLMNPNLMGSKPPIA